MVDGQPQRQVLSSYLWEVGFQNFKIFVVCLRLMQVLSSSKGMVKIESAALNEREDDWLGAREMAACNLKKLSLLRSGMRTGLYKNSHFVICPLRSKICVWQKE